MMTTIGLEEHAWTPGLRDAVTALEDDTRNDSVTMLNSTAEAPMTVTEVTGSLTPTSSPAHVTPTSSPP
jgi:hypothetical protein